MVAACTLCLERVVSAGTRCRVWSRRNRVGKRPDFFDSEQDFVPNLSVAAPPWWRLAPFVGEWICALFDARLKNIKAIAQRNAVAFAFSKRRNTANRVVVRLDLRQIGYNLSYRTNPDFESLPDSKSPRPSAAASVSGHHPPPSRRGGDRQNANSALIRTTKKSGRFPTRFRREQARQQLRQGSCLAACHAIDRGRVL